MKFADTGLITAFILLLLATRMGFLNMVGFVLLIGVFFIINGVFMKKIPPKNTKLWAGKVTENNDEARSLAIKLVAERQIIVGIILIVCSFIFKLSKFTLRGNPIIVGAVIIFFIFLVSYPSWSVERTIRKKYCKEGSNNTKI